MAIFNRHRGMEGNICYIYIVMLEGEKLLQTLFRP